MHLRQPFTPLADIESEYPSYPPTFNMTPVPLNLGQQFFSYNAPVVPLSQQPAIYSSSSSGYTIDPPAVSQFAPPLLSLTESWATETTAVTQREKSEEQITPAIEITSWKQKPQSGDDDSGTTMPKPKKKKGQPTLPSIIETKHSIENPMLRATIVSLEKQLIAANKEIYLLREYFKISSVKPQHTLPPFGRRNSQHRTNRAPHISIFSPETVVSRNGFTFFYNSSEFQQTPEEPTAAFGVMTESGETGIKQSNKSTRR